MVYGKMFYIKKDIYNWYLQREFEKSMIWPYNVQAERGKVQSGYEVSWYQPIAGSFN